MLIDLLFIYLFVIIHYSIKRGRLIFYHTLDKH